jgi:hypothetical protein
VRGQNQLDGGVSTCNMVSFTRQVEVRKQSLEQIFRFVWMLLCMLFISFHASYMWSDGPPLEAFDEAQSPFEWHDEYCPSPHRKESKAETPSKCNFAFDWRMNWCPSTAGFGVWLALGFSFEVQPAMVILTVGLPDPPFVVQNMSGLRWMALPPGSWSAVLSMYE